MVVLARVDQRLIHGLIVNQWAPHLQVKRFMVVDDVLCNNEEIKASMRMAKPAGTGSFFPACSGSIIRLPWSSVH